MPNIFKILDAKAFELARETGFFTGAEVDVKDGYIHFSAREQVAETAQKHFHGRDHLMLLCVDSAGLGPALKWEVSRGGALFPHLYAALDMGKVIWAKPLVWNGVAHDFPPETFQ